MNILNLPNFNVLEVKETEHDYGVVAVTSSPPSFCPHCGAFPNLSKFGSKKQVFMDLPMHGKRVGIVLNRQRYLCKECGSTFLERLFGIDDQRNCTVRLIEYVEQQSLKRTFTSIAEEIGVDEKSVRNIFNDYVDRLEAEAMFITPKWMGIDEIHILGKPRAVFTNVEDRTIVDLLSDRNKETIIKYLSRIKDKQTIEVVTMDMWNPYRQAVKEVLPHADIVVDKFHVVRMANVAVETVRKSVRKEIDAKQRRQLKNDRFLMLKRRRDLTPMETMILETWTLNFPQLKQAYEAKEGFYEIWNASDGHEALKRYTVWRSTIPKEMEPAFKDIFTAVNNWTDEIMSYFKHGVTNAYTESLNNLIRAVNRMGRGYSFRALRAKMLFSEGVKKKVKANYNRSHMLADIPHGYDPRKEENWSTGADISTLVRMIEEGRL